MKVATWFPKTVCRQVPHFAGTAVLEERSAVLRYFHTAKIA
jgi:hypothetical protein